VKRLRTSARVMVVALAWAIPASAGAFSDVTMYQLPPEVGGGGGRHFSGSPLDTYTCKACHEGGSAMPLRVRGFPRAGYRPSTSYEITVDWSDEVENVSMLLEITNMAGRLAGSLRLPADDEVEEPELCDPVESETLGARLVRISATPSTGEEDAADCSDRTMGLDCRELLFVPSCGSRRVRFLWTAPSKDIGPIRLSGSLVTANGDGAIGGDGVTDVSDDIRAEHEDPPVMRTYASCGVSAAGGGAPGSPAWALVPLLVLAARCRVGGRRKR
jgi:hypothetical protein